MRPRKTVSAGRALAEVAGELVWYFRRNGYVRRQNAKRLSREGCQAYKKGDEARLTAEDEPELHRIEALLRRAGFRPGRPFKKGRQYRLPLYGREEVRRFLRLVESAGNAEVAPREPRPSMAADHAAIREGGSDLKQLLREEGCCVRKTRVR